MKECAIIAIGYNNPKALARLLESLNRADYGEDQIPLIISLDKSDNAEVESVAKEFDWRHGIKEVRTFTERQGLRKHILSCGEYLHKYDALYIFEDDVLAAESYYQFGKACIDFYANDERIAGIALYSPAWNQNANFPFEPIRSQYDTYFMHLAPSLGQIWLKEPWFDFMNWYQNNQKIFEEERNSNLPDVLYRWGENSWLKYHIAYCEIKKKYYVYSYCSYTTDFVEQGTHFLTHLTRFQVSLPQGKRRHFDLVPLDDKAVTYDSFYENERIVQFFQEKNMEVKVDLYGCQTARQDKRFVLTTQSLPYKIVKEYALQLRPLDLNVLLEIEGKGIYLYDTKERVGKIPEKKGSCYVKRWDYFMRDRFLMWHEIVPLCTAKITNLVKIMCRRNRK